MGNCFPSICCCMTNDTININSSHDIVKSDINDMKSQYIKSIEMKEIKNDITIYDDYINLTEDDIIIKKIKEGKVEYTLDVYAKLWLSSGDKILEEIKDNYSDILKFKLHLLDEQIIRIDYIRKLGKLVYENDKQNGIILMSLSMDISDINKLINTLSPEILNIMKNKNDANKIAMLYVKGGEYGYGYLIFKYLNNMNEMKNIINKYVPEYIKKITL